LLCTADIPQEVDNYHYVCPLEAEPLNPLQKSSTFGYHTSVYKATNTKDGLTYCLRRIHGQPRRQLRLCRLSVFTFRIYMSTV